jgi:hypothetical protein
MPEYYIITGEGYTIHTLSINAENPGEISLSCYCRIDHLQFAKIPFMFNKCNL